MTTPDENSAVQRDPRTDPRPGDVLYDDPLILEVTLRVRSVHYRLTRKGGRGIDAISMNCRMSAPAWRKAMRNAEVVTVAPDAEAGR